MGDVVRAGCDAQEERQCGIAVCTYEKGPRTLSKPLLAPTLPATAREALRTRKSLPVLCRAVSSHFRQRL
jgi:hypothetical protein